MRYETRRLRMLKEFSERADFVAYRHKEDGSIMDEFDFNKDVEWLIEQAEQNHATSIRNTKLAIEFEKLRLENNRYREALESIWYRHFN